MHNSVNWILPNCAAILFLKSVQPSFRGRIFEPDPEPGWISVISPLVWAVASTNMHMSSFSRVTRLKLDIVGSIKTKTIPLSIHCLSQVVTSSICDAENAVASFCPLALPLVACES
jgi:hypothetical protein